MREWIKRYFSAMVGVISLRWVSAFGVVFSLYVTLSTWSFIIGPFAMIVFAAGWVKSNE